VRVRLTSGEDLQLPEDFLRALGITRGSEVPGETLERLREADRESRIYRRALRLLARRPRSTAELGRHLARLGPPEMVRAIQQRLEREGLLDDLRFAQLWAKSRRARRGLGVDRLRKELLARGVRREVIEEALRAVREEDEVELAERLAGARLRTYRGLEPRVAARRLGAYLARRGFPWATVVSVLRRVGLLDPSSGDSGAYGGI
jgi:regulatory protein